LLDNALAQTGWSRPPLAPETWRATLRIRLNDIRWEQVCADVEPFLQSPQESAQLTRKNLYWLSDGYEF
jgi:hypothetical protein